MSEYSLLSREELIAIVKDGVIDAPFENIKKTSIDVRLGASIMTEASYKDTSTRPLIDLSDESVDAVGTGWVKQPIPDEGYILEPGSYILAHT
jgi:deoxycytidine triphosphate deaminase